MPISKQKRAGITVRQEQAVVALMTQPNLAEAARVAGVTPQTLGRWMKDPMFEASWRMARSASFDQSIARLQKISGAAVTVLLRVMVDPETAPSVRLRAAETVYQHAKAARRVEDLEARLSDLERAKAAREPEPTTVASKLSAKQEQAIVALLTNRSIEEAARVIGVGSQTLYRWMKDPVFEAAWRGAGREAFGQAHRRLQQATAAAALTVIRIISDPLTPPSVIVTAVHLTLKFGLVAVEEDIGARIVRLGYSPEVAQAVLNGDRRPLEVIEKDLLRVAA